MKALVKKKAQRGLWLEDVPVPSFKANEVLIRVQKTSLCGTDLHIYEWDEWAQKTIPVPMVIGHEFFGVVEDFGSQVLNLKKGARVSGEGHLVCEVCRNCRAGKKHLCRNTIGLGVHRDGCFAEYVVLPASNLFEIPEEIPDSIASIFDPLGNAVHTALSFDCVGEDVLITGAGPIGLMAIPIVKKVGARHVVVTDVNPFRLKMAKDFGATRVVHSGQERLKDVILELGMKEGFDIGLEMSGNSSALSDLLEAMNHGGKIALLGIFPKKVETDYSQIIFKGLQLKGIYGREMYETWYKMKNLLLSGLKVDSVITHELSALQFQEGFEAMTSGKAGKVVLDWSDHSLRIE